MSQFGDSLLVINDEEIDAHVIPNTQVKCLIMVNNLVN